MNTNAIKLLFVILDRHIIIYQVKLAYENVKEVDCLDTTKDGNEQWEDAMKRYEQRIDQVMLVIKCYQI